MPADDNTTISFRLPSEFHDVLVRLADASGTTKHQFARTLIVQALDCSGRVAVSVDAETLEEAFEDLRNAVADMRTAIGRGFGAVLQDVSPKRNRDEIRQWVFERIITPTPKSRKESDGPR